MRSERKQKNHAPEKKLSRSQSETHIRILPIQPLGDHAYCHKLFDYFDSVVVHFRDRSFRDAKSMSAHDPKGCGYDDDTIADDFRDAITEEATDYLWIFGGGNPGDVRGGEKRLTKLIYAIHQKTIALRVDRPKPMMAYCFSVPLLLYLSSRGLVKSIHGPVAQEIPHLDGNPKTIGNIKSIFKSHGEKLKITYEKLQPCNTACNTLISGEVQLQGYIVGGVLQIVLSALKVALMAQEHLGVNNIITGKPLLLFIELLDFSDEVDKANELVKLVAENKISVKALALGTTIPNTTRNPDPSYPQKYHQRIDSTLNGIAQAADQLSIPVVKGLNVGHSAHQEALPISYGQLSVQGASLVVSYDTVKPLKFLDIGKHLLWNRKQLAAIGESRAETKEQPNNVSELCTLL